MAFEQWSSEWFAKSSKVIALPISEYQRLKEYETKMQELLAEPEKRKVTEKMVDHLAKEATQLAFVIVLPISEYQRLKEYETKMQELFAEPEKRKVTEKMVDHLAKEAAQLALHCEAG
jgi:hypothetical protein